MENGQQVPDNIEEEKDIDYATRKETGLKFISENLDREVEIKMVSSRKGMSRKKLSQRFWKIVDKTQREPARNKCSWTLLNTFKQNDLELLRTTEHWEQGFSTRIRQLNGIVF